MRELDPDDARPPYLQLADRFRSAIEAGEYLPGGKLPTHAQIVSEYGVSVATVKKALATLQTAGLVVSRRGEGAFVRTGPDDTTAAKTDDTDSLRRAIEQLTARLDRVEARLDGRL